MLRFKNDRFYVTTTRFNNETYKQNEQYRIAKDIDGCVYGTPQEMPNYIPIGSKVFVFEMNNQTNKVEGIGYLTNRLYTRKRFNIYKDRNYNRYSYIGKHRVDRYDMTEDMRKNLEVIEELIFKGKGHLKRGQGITSFTQEKLDKNKKLIWKFLVSIFID
tara:strand:- start:569 stop:1048 length:480 start_codon:yes stop_codon:yes gene_type:complete